MNRDPTNTECTRDPIFILQKKSGRCWIPELVFLTREEGEDYARRHEHNYPKGWQVYCIPCEGELAKLLKAVPETADGKPLMIGDTVWTPNEDRGEYGSYTKMKFKIDSINAGLSWESYKGDFTVGGQWTSGGGIEAGNLDVYADRNNCPVGTDFQ